MARPFRPAPVADAEPNQGKPLRRCQGNINFDLPVNVICLCVGTGYAPSKRGVAPLPHDHYFFPKNFPNPKRTCTVFTPGFGTVSPAFEMCM